METKLGSCRERLLRPFLHVKSPKKERVICLSGFCETVLAWMLVLTVLVGCIDLLRLIVEIIMSPPGPSYALLENLLGHALLLVVGLELALMLLKRSTGSVIEVMLFVVARKTVVHTKSALDLIIGVAAIAGLFAIRRFLFVQKIDVGGAGTALSAATRVRDANAIAAVTMPLDIAETLGGLVYHLAQDKQVRQGDKFHIADAEIQVAKVVDGVVEKVLVSSLSTEGGA